MRHAPTVGGVNTHVYVCRIVQIPLARNVAYPQPSANMAATDPLREALNQGISSGNFADTKIILFSHRDSSGNVCRPKALYASSHVLKTIPEFKASECTITFDTSLRPHDAMLKVLSGGFAESQLKDPKEAIDEEEYAENYEYLSDSDLEEDGDELKVPTPKRIAKSNVTRSDSSETETPGEDSTEQEDSEPECVEKLRVIKIQDVAFVT